MFGTFRARLTATSVLVMGALMCALGLAIYVAANQALMSSVDSDLVARVARMEEDHHRMQQGPMAPRSFSMRPPPSDPMRTLHPRVFPVGNTVLSPAPRESPYDSSALGTAQKGRTTLQTVTISGEEVRLYTRPMLEKGKVVAVVQAPYALGDLNRSMENLQRILLLIIPLGLVLTGLASRYLVARMMEPLRRINEDAEAIGARNLAGRVHVTGQDEFAALGTTLNGMLSRLEDAFANEQATSRKLEATVQQQRRFTADASHELKTPLAVIKANAGLALMDDGLSDLTRESLDDIAHAADRMNGLVQGLLMLARAESGSMAGRLEPVLLNDLVSLSVRQARRGVPVEMFIPDTEVWIEASRDDLLRTITNLIDNAVLHAQANRIEVCLSADGRIEVSDDGVGIDPRHLPHLFDRFYRADDSRSSDTGGTGLGLAICKGIVDVHKGTISVQSQPGVGTCFTITVPILAGSLGIASHLRALC